MKLSEHIGTVHKRSVLLHLCGSTALLGAFMLVPLAVSLLFGELTYSYVFAGISGGSLLFGLSLWNAFSPRELELIDAIVITALVYLLFSLVGAIPFLPVKSFFDAWLEAMSGFTTTGLSVMNEAEIARTLLFYRAYTQWIGGMGIIIVSLAILLRPGKAAFKLYSAEFGERNIMGSVEATAKVVIRIYLGLTVIGFVAYLLAGMGPFDGLIHILTTIPTGGFSAFPTSIGHYNDPIVSLTVCLFMILGAISFPLYYETLKGGAKVFLEDSQVRGLLVLTLSFSILFLLSFGIQFTSLVPALFQSVTSITTTGFNTVPTAGLSEPDKLLTTVLMVIGGGTGSTAGGIKVFRFLILLGFIRITFFRTLLPREAKVPFRFGALKVDEREAEGVAAFFVLYLFILISSTLGMMWLEGSLFTDTLFEIASAEGTVGLSVGLTGSSLTVGSKLILIVNMWLGRLEIIPVMVALYPASWAGK